MTDTILSIWRGPIPTPRDHIAEIFADVARRHRTTVDLIKGDSRHSEVVKARQEVMYRLRGLRRDDGAYRLSFPRIGQILGRDHTTIQFGVKRHERRLAAGSEQ